VFHPGVHARQSIGARSDARAKIDRDDQVSLLAAELTWSVAIIIVVPFLHVALEYLCFTLFEGDDNTDDGHTERNHQPRGGIGTGVEVYSAPKRSSLCR
jgi:hypothetical protein